MNAESFADYLKNPSKLYQTNYQELKSLALQYPYCQNLQWLLLQKSNMDGHRDAAANLEKTATLSIDRTLLYKKMKALAATQNTTSDFLFTDEVLELPNLSNFRRPEPIFREAVPVAPLENKVISTGKENLIPPALDVKHEEDLFDLSKLQVPPKPVELPDIQPDPAIIEPLTTPEIPQPADPSPMQPSQEPEIQNPMDPEPTFPGEQPTIPGIEKQVAIEWDLTPRQASETEAPPKASINSRARMYQPPVLQQFKPKPATSPAKPTKEEQVTAIIENSVAEKEGLVSETLANILARQGKYERAIKMYEQLILKNPEKSAYFAAQIQKLK